VHSKDLHILSTLPLHELLVANQNQAGIAFLEPKCASHSSLVRNTHSYVNEILNTTAKYNTMFFHFPLKYFELALTVTRDNATL
jgi:hypothetical protein